MSYTIPYNLYVQITEQIISHLRDDPELHEGLPEPVQIYKGPRRLSSISDRCAVFVYRSSTRDYAYTQGERQVDIDAVWAVTCVTRHMADPEQLDDYVSILCVNVLRNLMAHQQQPGLWLVAMPGPHDAVTVRDDQDQSWEIEVIPLALRFDHALR